MYITSIELTRFIPMGHGGITYFKGTVASVLTTILAQNGIGKSSLLRELSPYPAVRSDYGPNGKKVVTIHHEGSEYCLTSDFSNRQKAHSFVKDGNELNLSGNTDTQEDLVEHHFGLTSSIWSLMTNTYQISKMGRQDRKNFFMAIHPFNLTLLYDHHRSVASQIRQFSNNIKLMQERHVTIKSQLLDPYHIENCRKDKANLEQFGVMLDQAIFCIDQDAERHKSSDIYKELVNARKLDLDTARTMIEAQLKEIQVIKTLYPELHTVGEEVWSTIKDYEATIAQERALVETHEQHAAYLKNEIEQFQSLWTSNSEDSLEDLIKRFEYLKTKKESLVVDPTIPIIDTVTLHTLELEDHPLLNDWVIQFKASGVEAWPDEKLREYDRKISERILQKLTLEQRIAGYQQRLDVLATRRLKESEYSYPKSCVIQCEMKQALLSVLARTDTEIQQLTSEMSQVSKELIEVTSQLESLQKAIEGPRSGVPLIKKIEALICKQAYGNFILDNKDLCLVLNTNPHSILYNTVKLIQNSKLYHERCDVDKECTMLAVRITTLENAHIPSKEVLMKTLEEKQLRHDLTLRKIDTIEWKIAAQQEQYQHLVQFQTILTKIISMSESFQKYYQFKLIERHLEFDSMMKHYYTEKRRWVNEQLLTIDRILKTQDGLLTRLNDEVLPTLQTLTKKREQWMTVVSALSPTDGGLPHTYLVRFINGIITLANSYIKSVWSYDMEIDLIDEQSSLEFDLPFTLYKNAHVKDLGIGSNGQQAIFDMALNLAIAQYHGYGTKYPLKYDEMDAALSPHHRTKMLEWINLITRKGIAKQIFWVNHHASLYSGFTDNKFWVLSEDNIVLPAVYNEHVEIR